MHILYQSNTIIIREFLPEEIALFTTLFEDEDVTRYLPYRSPEQYVELFHQSLEDYRNGPFSRWAIFDAVNNTFAGMCLARHFADVPTQIEIGYILSKAYWGKGLATEVSKALVHYCFSRSDTNEVVAVTAPGNTGSQKVLEKAGFTRLADLIRPDRGAFAYFMIQRT
ncbi:GNAT family N-acetyltransferase [Chitinophaga vietnamensis]|uniref:GNAT family N-acetyltransferase n=1 Tax=Chitinophaga vietnamensis TaxID=2593957 RepID=UPI001177A2AF|nr:GNAT family N-acetyltransferase [Chitinophaga vietnamensis]